MLRLSSKKIILTISILITFALLWSLTVVNATSTKGSLDNKIDNAENKLNENKNKQNNISNEMSDLEKKIKSAEQEIGSLTDEVVLAQEKVEAAKKKLEEEKKKFEEGNENLQARLRNIYKGGSLGFFDVILSSGNVSDLFSNLEMVKYIFKNDKDVVGQLKANYEAIEKEAEELASYQKELENKQITLSAKQDALGADHDVLASKNKKIAAENAELEKQIAKWQADSAAIEDQINGSQNGGGGYKPPTGESSKGFTWPVPGYTRVSSAYGWRTLNGIPDFHLGIDIPSGGRSSAVVAAKDGKVIATGGQHWSYGNIVIIDHGNGVATAYAHNKSIAVRNGQIVKKGQTIAYTGNTGNSFGIHLHFEVRINGKTVNPMAYF